MRHCPDGITSDRHLDANKNTLALVQENSAMSVRWWDWGKQQIGIAITALGLANAIGIIASSGDYAVAQSQIIPIAL